MGKTASKGAARFTTAYTQEQRDALLRAVIIDGHTVRNAIDMANTGQLGVPAFGIGRYAYDLVRDGREAFEARNDDALESALTAELKHNAIAALANNRALRRQLKADGRDDVDALRRNAQAIAAIQKARRDTEPRAKAKPAPVQTNPTTDAPEPKTADVLQGLLAKQQAKPSAGARFARSRPDETDSQQRARGRVASTSSHRPSHTLREG